jgi:hypothetical protein
MVTVSRRVLLSFLVLLLAPPVCSVFATDLFQAGEAPSCLTGTEPTEHLSPPVWQDYLSWPSSSNDLSEQTVRHCPSCTRKKPVMGRSDAINYGEDSNLERRI